MNDVEMDQLTETRNRLIKEMIVLGFDTFNRRPSPEQWSIAQVCHHLALVEKASLQAIIMGSQNHGTKIERKNIHFILELSNKIQAPEIVEPGEGPFEVQQVMKWLQNSRKELLVCLSSIEDKSILEKKSYRHSVFGDLSLLQWIEMLYLHEQHHIEQIREIKRSIGIRN